MTVAGIDNGLSGGMVILDGDGNVLDMHVTPTLEMTAKKKGKRQYDVARMVWHAKTILSGLDEKIVYLEKARPMPKQGVSSMFSIGYGFGLWQGILTALGIPYEIVDPRRWQDEMFRDINSNDTKQASAIIAGRLSPGTDWRANERCRKPHSGLTDAYCIAEYGRRRRIINE